MKALLEHFNYILCSRYTEGWLQALVCIISRRGRDIKIETVAAGGVGVGGANDPHRIMREVCQEAPTGQLTWQRKNSEYSSKLHSTKL
jgi:hypothetical protein